MYLEHIDKGIRHISLEIAKWDEENGLRESVLAGKCLRCNQGAEEFDHIYYVITDTGLLWWHMWPCLKDLREQNG